MKNMKAIHCQGNFRTLNSYYFEKSTMMSCPYVTGQTKPSELF